MNRLIFALLVNFLLIAPAVAAEPIRIGEFLSHTAFPSYTKPFTQGRDLAVDEINKAGGVLGRPLEILSRDDMNKPDEAARIVEELVLREKVDAIMGGLASHVGLGGSQACLRNRVPCVMAFSVADRLLEEDGHPYVFRIPPSTSFYAITLAAEAAKQPATRWAIVAPQYEFGINIVETFKKELKRLRPDVEFVTEKWSPLKKLEAGPTIAALAQDKPEAVFVTYPGSDFSAFVREGMKRDFFTSKYIMTPFAGMRQDLGDMLDEIPEGWTTLGYQAQQIDLPAYKPFRDAYAQRYGDMPDQASYFAYSIVQAIKAAIEKAGSTDRQAVRDALAGLTFPTPQGDLTFMEGSNQSTDGLWLGTTGRDDKGHFMLKDMKRVDASKFVLKEWKKQQGEAAAPPAQ